MHWRLRKCDENFLIKQTKFGSKHTCLQIQNTITSKTQSAKSDLKHSLAKEKHSRVQISSKRALDVEKTIHFDTAGVKILDRHLLHISQRQVPPIQATNK